MAALQNDTHEITTDLLFKNNNFIYAHINIFMFKMHILLNNVHIYFTILILYLRYRCAGDIMDKSSKSESRVWILIKFRGNNMNAYHPAALGQIVEIVPGKILHH